MSAQIMKGTFNEFFPGVVVKILLSSLFKIFKLCNDYDFGIFKKQKS